MARGARSRHDRPRRRHQRGLGRVHQVGRGVAADRGQPRGDRGVAPRGLARRRRHESVRRRARSLRRGDARARFTSTCASACARPGGELAGVYYCPHLPDAGCDCRKPRPGMFRALERELGVSVARRAVHRRSHRATSRPRRPSARGRCSCARERARRPKRLLGARDVPVFDDLAAAARSLLDETR